MAYTTVIKLKALVPDGWVTAALDDDSSGDGEKFEDVLAVAEQEVNGSLGLRYAVPLATATDFIASITTYICAEIVYGRRNMQEHFPYKDALAVMRRQLRDIAAGDLPLTPGVDRKQSSVSVISEDSRVWSDKINT
jgi:phage gp36-like protein